MEQMGTPPVDASASSPLPPPPGRITGECRTPSGQPLAGLRINVFSTDGVIVDTQVTGANGRFATRLLYAGPYRVEARVPGQGLSATEECRVELGEITRVVFTLDL